MSIEGIVAAAFALLVWGGTENGFYALDGSFSINLDWPENVVRFGRIMNWVNLFFLGVLASALSFVAWSKACAALGVVRTTICLYLEPIIGVGFGNRGDCPRKWAVSDGNILICPSFVFRGGRPRRFCFGDMSAVGMKLAWH